MCVHNIFSSDWAAEWPPFGKELLTRLIICYLCILTICNFMGALWPSGKVSDSGARGRGFDNYLRCVVSLSKKHIYSPQTNGNAREAVAPSQDD